MQHILHVFKHGMRLGKERGMLVGELKNERDKRMPIADLRAVVIAARGVTFSSELIAALAHNHCIVLHAGPDYQPVAVTAGLARIVHAQAAINQGKLTSQEQARYWRPILRQKIQNQVAHSHALSLPCPIAEYEARQRKPNEARAAKAYWKNFFNAVNEPIGRDQAGNTPANAMLNYGYAILAALCHRAIIVHGLNPLYGLHHVLRARAHALVYDVIEPLRPFLDAVLVAYLRKKGDRDMQGWAKFAARRLGEATLEHPNGKIKFLDGIDVYVKSLADAIGNKEVKQLWVPEFPHRMDSQWAG